MIRILEPIKIRGCQYGVLCMRGNDETLFIYLILAWFIFFALDYLSVIDANACDNKNIIELNTENCFSFDDIETATQNNKNSQIHIMQSRDRLVKRTLDGLIEARRNSIFIHVALCVVVLATVFVRNLCKHSRKIKTWKKSWLETRWYW